MKTRYRYHSESVLIFAASLLAVAVPVPAIDLDDFTVGGSPSGIVQGPDGAMWFIECGDEYSDNAIGRLSIDGEYTQYPVATINAFGWRSIATEAITAGPDGAVWFTMERVGRIGRISPDGEIVEFEVPTPTSGPRGITAGPDGNLWFTESTSGAVAKMTTAGVVTEYPTPGGPPLFGIITGPDGHVWYAGNGAIGKMAVDGSVVEFPTNQYWSPRSLTIGPDGQVWFVLGCCYFGTIDTEGQITLFPSPAGGHNLHDLTVGPDRRIWITTPFGEVHVVDPVTMANVVVTVDGELDGVSPGPGATLWVTSYTWGEPDSISKVVRLTLDEIPTVHFESLIPAAAVAAGAQGAFFQTDVEINNAGDQSAEVAFHWLPRGQDNPAPAVSESYVLEPGQSRRFENVLSEAFGLAPDSAGAVRMVSSSDSVIGMSRTYNIPGGKTAGTFGQELPAVRDGEMIAGSERRRIIFMSEDSDSRANVGCVNGTAEQLQIKLGVFDDSGAQLEVKTMDLGPYGNNQINRVFRPWQPVSGYVDVWSDTGGALFYCYGSMLDNQTSDPTTILPQVPSNTLTFIPAAALASGLEGAFFQTDVDLNNVGLTSMGYEFLWLPRGANNSEPVRSEPFSLAPGAGVRYGNVLDEVFGFQPNQAGALALDASGTDLLAMSRTYNVPGAKLAGTFGQGIPGIPADRMMQSGERRRIIFMNENDELRSNVGCQNGSDRAVRVNIELFNSAGESLEIKTMDLSPMSNNQFTRIFRDHAPISAGYVDVWTDTPDAAIYCYGSVLDNTTSDPTTVLPQ